MIVYLAGSFAFKTKFREYATELRQFCGVTSRWLDQPEADDSQIKDHLTLTKEGLLATYAQKDLIDIDLSNWFVQISEVPNVRGGAHTELGYAIARDKNILIVGNDHNVFHYLPQVHQVQTWPEAVTFLKEQKHAEDSNRRIGRAMLIHAASYNLQNPHYSEMRKVLEKALRVDLHENS